MKTPQEATRALEHAWSRGSAEGLGYGVLRLPFACDELLSFARLPGPDGPPVTWLGHRDADGRWSSVYDEGEPGNAARDTAPGAIRIHWGAGPILSLSAPEHRIHWSLRLSSTPRTRALTALGLLLSPGLRRVAETLPGVRWTRGAVGRLSRQEGAPEPSGPDVQIRPHRLWSVEASAAVVGGRELGPLRADADCGPRRTGASTRPRFLLGRAMLTERGRRS